MPPLGIEFQKFSCRHFNTGTTPFLLGVRGEKYQNTFIVTDANDCPNLLSYGATFRMGVLIPNYPRDVVVEGENVPHFSKMSGDKSASNVFQILGDIQK